MFYGAHRANFNEHRHILSTANVAQGQTVGDTKREYSAI